MRRPGSVRTSVVSSVPKGGTFAQNRSSEPANVSLTPDPAPRAGAALPDCVGYVRVSTERQAGEVYSSRRDQQRAIEQLAARLGRTGAAWYRDEGASGATATRRPAFMELLAYCESHPRSPQALGFVLVLNDSRF